MADYGKIVKGALRAIKEASGEAGAVKSEGKIADILGSQTAPMTTPSGTGLPFLPQIGRAHV